MKKIFTFLVAFLATMSGAVWAETDPYAPAHSPYDLATRGGLKITNDGVYYVYSSSETNNGITVEGSVSDLSNPTIHLVGININVEGTAIHLRNYSNPTFIIKGENKITSQGSDAAIKVYGAILPGASFNVDGTSTGILDIEMTGDNSNVAIGDRESLAGTMADCGSVMINGGTIKTNGNIGEFHQHAFRFGGNAIVIANNIEGFDYNSSDRRSGGLLFLNDDTPYIGEFHTPEQDPEFTLSSPLPEPYKIEIRSGGVEVTIGEGQSLTESQVDLQGGTLNAYKVVYDMNKPANLTDVNPATVPSIYCGANTPLATIDPTLNPADTYYYFGWANGNNITTQTAGNTPNQVENVDAKAVWVVASKKVTTEKGSAIEAFSLVYPETVTGINFTPAESTTLPDALTNNSNKISGTLNASGTTKYTASYGEKSETVTLTFEATETKINLEEEGAFLIQGVKDLTYNGQVQTPNVQVLDVDAGKNLDVNINYTVSYEPSEVKNAQQYTVTVTGTGAYEGTLTETFNVNKADAKVTAADVEWTIGTAGPTFTDKLKATGVEADKNKLTVASFINPTGTWDKAGVYKVTYTDIKLNNDLAGNYKEVADVDGKLIVKKTGNDDDPIKPGDPDDPDTEIKIDDGEGGWEWRENGYTRVYDGEKHSLKADNLVYVRQKGGENEWVAVPASAITVTSVSPEGDIKNQGTYTVKLSIAEAKDILYSGTVGDITLVITPRPMIVTIDPLTAEDLEKETVSTDMVTFEEEGDDRGLVTDEPAGVSGKMKVTENTASSVEGEKSYTVEFSELKLMDSGDKTSFLADNYTPTFKYGDTELKDGAGTIPDVTIDDITPGDDTDIDDGDGDDNNWTWDADTYVIIYDGKGHGVATVTVDGDPVQPTTIIYRDAEDVELSNDELPTEAGHYTAEVVVTVGETSQTGTFPLWIKERPLAICFDLSGLSEEYTGYPLDASEFVDYREVPGEAISGLVDGQIPGELEGTITIASEPNANGKYAVTFEKIAPVENGAFTPLNYEEHYYLDGVEIDLSTGGNTVGDGNDDFPGIEIDDNTSSGGSGIGTKRYQLFLANKDYTFLDVKTDYADEGLELFSRHDKKYTKAGGSFTVWYEKDGVANAGGYRIFWSNKANGDYKEVKFDTVSEYFQIRNVQSNVYVKIYAADGFPVGNEEISAADYRAYAQPNKIVVITPQPTDVQIISMAGAVVATDKVTGQREFANLTEGVYIVRMGETVVKLQVRK